MARSGITPQSAGAARGAFDWELLSIASAMLVFGVVMVFSASYPYSVLGAEHPFYFVARQLLWVGVGAAIMLVLARIPFTVWEKWAVPIFVVTMLSLMVLLVIGVARFGSTRTFFGGSVQPSQPAKVAIVIYVAAWLASKGDRIRNVRAGLIPFSVLLGFLTVLIVFQPSISTAVLIVITAAIMFFVAGAAIGQLLVILLLGATTFWLLISNSSYAGDRVQRYVESVWNPLLSTEHQVQQSVQALTTGGPLGVGVGQGTGQMVGYVPLAWTDNIYAIVGQELGFVGAVLVIVLFGLLTWWGLRIAMRCRDPFGMLLALGLSVMLATQALLNMAVVVAIVPPTGVPLPFFSYGGSSMVTAMAAVGLLLSISRFGRTIVRPPAKQPPLPTPPVRTPINYSSQSAGARSTSDASSDIRGRDGRSRLPGAGSSGATGKGSKGASGGFPPQSASAPKYSGGEPWDDTRGDPGIRYG
jgi:cell division protein FtsW